MRATLDVVTFMDRYERLYRSGDIHATASAPDPRHRAAIQHLPFYRNPGPPRAPIKARRRKRSPPRTVMVPRAWPLTEQPPSPETLAIAGQIVKTMVSQEAISKDRFEKTLEIRATYGLDRLLPTIQEMLLASPALRQLETPGADFILTYHRPGLPDEIQRFTFPPETD